MARTTKVYLGRVYYIMHRPAPLRKPGDMEKELAKEMCDTYNRAYFAGYQAGMANKKRKEKK